MWFQFQGLPWPLTASRGCFTTPDATLWLAYISVFLLPLESKSSTVKKSSAELSKRQAQLSSEGSTVLVFSAINGDFLRNFAFVYTFKYNEQIQTQIQFALKLEIVEFLIARLARRDPSNNFVVVVVSIFVCHSLKFLSISSSFSFWQVWTCF